MMYRETLNPIYLEQARKIGNFLVSHPRLPEDKVPYWDYDDPQIPNAKRDASAASIMASAFIELSQLDPSNMASIWLATAENNFVHLAHLNIWQKRVLWEDSLSSMGLEIYGARMK